MGFKPEVGQTLLYIGNDPVRLWKTVDGKQNAVCPVMVAGDCVVLIENRSKYLKQHGLASAYRGYYDDGSFVFKMVGSDKGFDWQHYFYGGINTYFQPAEPQDIIRCKTGKSTQKVETVMSRAFSAALDKRV